MGQRPLGGGSEFHRQGLGQHDLLGRYAGAAGWHRHARRRGVAQTLGRHPALPTPVIGLPISNRTMEKAISSCVAGIDYRNRGNDNLVGAYTCVTALSGKRRVDLYADNQARNPAQQERSNGYRIESGQGN